MDLSEIIIDLEDLLEKYLRRKYNPNVKNASFFTYKQISFNSFTIREKVNSVRIYNTNPDRTIEALQFDFRIPQSRVYYREIQAPEFVLQSIHCFDDQVIIFKNIDRKNDLRLETTQEIQCIPEVNVSETNHYDLSGLDQIIIIFKPSLVKDVKKLPAYWRRIMDAEIALHPLNQMRSNDYNVLCNIDQLWSEVDQIGRNRTISVNGQKELDFYDFIWIQELYLHFGWFRELDDFYKSLNVSALRAEQGYILWLLFNRYQHIYLVQGRDALEETKYKAQDEEVNISEFLSFYLNQSLLSDSQLNEKIQAFWEYFNIPARRLRTSEYVQKNPDECIALALLAQGHHFWWISKLADHLNLALHGSKRVLFNILFQIKKVVNLKITKEGFTISGFPESISTQYQDRLLNHYRFKQVKQRSAEITHLDINTGSCISIDKIVAIEYVFAESALKIHPLVCGPLNLPDVNNSCSISVADHKLQVPLIWSKFTINFFGNRFKFLRKKDRYQVSVKIKKGIESLFINGSELFSEKGLYQKQYVNIKKGEGTVHVDVFDRFGSRLSQSVKQIVFMGFGLDRYGIMQSDFQIYEDHGKSRRIKLDGISCNVILKNPNIAAWVLRGKYQLKQSIKLSRMPDLCNQLLYTDPDWLKNTLIIYTDHLTPARYREITEQCRERLGFIPKIRKLSELRAYSSYVTIIISDQEIGLEIFRTDLFSLIRFKDNKKHIGLQLKENNYAHLFTADFFQWLRHQNKFDLGGSF